MKKLYLMRHGNASFDSSDDFTRNLTKVGKKNVNKVAKYAIKNNIVPELIYCSIAQRVVETVSLFTSKLNHKFNIIKKESFYIGEFNDYIKIFNDINNKINSVMIVGHNPIMTELIKYITNESLPDTISLPQAGFVEVEMFCDWCEISNECGEIINYIY
jgi:phosphohistidine phosphatase